MFFSRGLHTAQLIEQSVNFGPIANFKFKIEMNGHKECLQMKAKV